MPSKNRCSQQGRGVICDTARFLVGSIEISDAFVPVHVLVLFEEYCAVRSFDLAPVVFSGLCGDAHVVEMVLALEREENAVGAGRIFSAAVALLVVLWR